MVYVTGHPLTVRSIRPADRGYQVAFEEVPDRTGAEQIRNLDVFVAERRLLQDGEFWPDELIGLQVRPGGGVIVGVEHGPAQDRLVIEQGSTRFEVPFVEALVPVVNLEDGYVEIVELEGLTDAK